MKIFKSLIFTLAVIFLVSCGDSNPAITHITVKSDRLGVLLDTDDRATVKVLQKIFYEKEEQPDAGPEFKYFIDLTINNKTQRWQYSIEGYIRNYEIINGMIYQLKDVAEFNRKAMIH
jgi:hypothetical protein